jgi:hypothetical protein
LVVPALADLTGAAMAEREPNPNDDQLRRTIANRLAAGLETEAWPRAETSVMVNEIIGRLRAGAGDLDKKLIIAGFTDHAVEAGGLEQACETCMYFLLHRRFCELPELMVPVDPHWSCRLWRI